MYEALTDYIEKMKSDLNDIPEDRKHKLQTIADFIRTRREHFDTAKLTFICTHNSRRSHFCQIWAFVVARYFGLDRVQTFSGGTEATAFNPRAVAALERAGFKIEDPGGENPQYEVFFDEEEDPLICYSKTFDDPVNPGDDFVAVMTCSDADENCPYIPGASARVSLPFRDPKESDGTAEEAEVYDARCKQIAAEMVFMVSRAVRSDFD